MLCLHVLSYSIDASEIADLHVISYEVERDLTPLILSNCQYRVERGAENLQEFDLEKIQRQLASRFLQGKPRLSLKGIPTLVYRRDRNYEHLFLDIRNKMPQVSAGTLSIGTCLIRALLSPFAPVHAQARPSPGAPLSFGDLPESLSPLLVPEGEQAASWRTFARERTEIPSSVSRDWGRDHVCQCRGPRGWRLPALPCAVPEAVRTCVRVRLHVHILTTVL